MSSHPSRPSPDHVGAPGDPGAASAAPDPFAAALPGDPFAAGPASGDPFAHTAPSTVGPISPVLPVSFDVGASTTPRRTRKAGLGPRERVSKGGWWAFGLVVGGLLFACLALYLTFDELNLLSGHPIGSALLWLAGWAIGCGVITVGLMVAVVVLARRRPVMLPAIALVVGVVLAPLAFFAVTQIGIDSVLTEARESVGPAAGDTVAAVADYAEQHDVDLGPFGPLLHALGSG